MGISAINNNVSFKGLCLEDMTPEKSQKIKDAVHALCTENDVYEYKTDENGNSYCCDCFPSEESKKSTKKKPLEVATTLILAAGLAYVGSRKVANTLTEVFPGVTKKLANKIGEIASNKVAPKIDKGISSLESSSKKSAEVAGSLLRKASVKVSDFFRDGLEGTEGVIEASKKTIGMLGTAVFMPKFVNVDGDENGEKDYLEKGQNAYVNLVKTADGITNLINVLS